MSTTLTKRRHADAVADAMALQALFPAHTYKRFVLGGSIRRKRPEVGDVEIIVEPAFDDVPSQSSLFAEPKRVNLFWDHLDSLIPAGLVQKQYIWREQLPLGRSPARD